MTSPSIRFLIHGMTILVAAMLVACASRKTVSTSPSFQFEGASDGVMFSNPEDSTGLDSLLENWTFQLDRAPEVIDRATPEYPEMARKEGVEGVVWVKVLIWNDGIVKDAKVTRANPTNRGFEESALRAAYATRWKPAVYQNLPVALWVTYEIEFLLSRFK